MKFNQLLAAILVAFFSNCLWAVKKEKRKEAPQVLTKKDTAKSIYAKLVTQFLQTKEKTAMYSIANAAQEEQDEIIRIEELLKKYFDPSQNPSNSDGLLTELEDEPDYRDILQKEFSDRIEQWETLVTEYGNKSSNSSNEQLSTLEQQPTFNSTQKCLLKALNSPGAQMACKLIASSSPEVQEGLVKCSLKPAVAKLYHSSGLLDGEFIKQAEEAAPSLHAITKSLSNTSTARTARSPQKKESTTSPEDNPQEMGKAILSMMPTLLKALNQADPKEKAAIFEAFDENSSSIKEQLKSLGITSKQVRRIMQKPRKEEQRAEVKDAIDFLITQQDDKQKAAPTRLTKGQRLQQQFGVSNQLPPTPAHLAFVDTPEFNKQFEKATGNSDGKLTRISEAEAEEIAKKLLKEKNARYEQERYEIIAHMQQQNTGHGTSKFRNLMDYATFAQLPSLVENSSIKIGHSASPEPGKNAAKNQRKKEKAKKATLAHQSSTTSALSATHKSALKKTDQPSDKKSVSFASTASIAKASDAESPN